MTLSNAFLCTISHEIEEMHFVLQIILFFAYVELIFNINLSVLREVNPGSPVTPAMDASEVSEKQTTRG